MKLLLAIIARRLSLPPAFRIGSIMEYLDGHPI